MSTTLKPLKLLETETGYRITKYIKTLELIPIQEPKLNLWQRIKRIFKEQNRCYNYLTNKQKSILHTIAPIWANIIQHNLDGRMTVTADDGKRYNLNAVEARHCLVGEVYGFGNTTCHICFNFNMHAFASLNHVDMRNCSYLKIYEKLANFLDHYYEAHLESQLTLQNKEKV